MNKIVRVVLAVAVVIAIAGAYLFPSIQNLAQDLGANSGPDSTNQCESQNGVQICKHGQKLVVATTTPCSIKSPSATSTLLSAALQVNTGTSTATTLHLATSTSAFATTSLLVNPLSLASGALGSFHYNGTTTNNGSIASGILSTGVDILPPNTYVNWGVEGFRPNSSETTKFLGTCSAEFKVF